MNRVWSICRAVMAVLIAVAVIAQARATMADAAGAGRDVVTTVVNFFSFFTIWSNCLAVIVLAVAALAAFGRPRRDRESRGLSLALAAASTYMIVTGVVYNLLLRGIELPQGTTLAWSNEILHLVGPLFLLADVLITAPSRPAMRWSGIGAILVVPVIWVLYTVIRGPLVQNPRTLDHWWYPYPFLDPHQVPGGGLGVAGYILAIAVVIVLVALGVRWWLNARTRVGE